MVSYVKMADYVDCYALQSEMVPRTKCLLGRIVPPFIPSPAASGPKRHQRKCGQTNETC